MIEAGQTTRLDDDDTAKNPYESIDRAIADPGQSQPAQAPQHSAQPAAKTRPSMEELMEQGDHDKHEYLDVYVKDCHTK